MTFQFVFFKYEKNEEGIFLEKIWKNLEKILFC